MSSKECQLTSTIVHAGSNPALTTKRSSPAVSQHTTDKGDCIEKRLGVGIGKIRLISNLERPEAGPFLF